MEEDFICLCAATYKELFPRMTEEQKKILPLYITVKDTTILCDNREQFRIALMSPSSEFIFWKAGFIQL